MKKVIESTFFCINAWLQPDKTPLGWLSVETMWPSGRTVKIPVNTLQNIMDCLPRRSVSVTGRVQRNLLIPLYFIYISLIYLKNTQMWLFDAEDFHNLHFFLISFVHFNSVLLLLCQESICQIDVKKFDSFYVDTLFMKLNVWNCFNEWPLMSVQFSKT